MILNAITIKNLFSMQTSPINASRYIPSDLTESIVKPEIGLEVYWNSEKLSAIGFNGKSKKSNFYYRFRTPEQMTNHIEVFVKNTVAAAERKAAEKVAKKSANAAISAADHFSIGDIIVNSWGWEQTNVNFYVVTAVKGKTITVSEVYLAQVEGSMYSHGMACEVVPTTELKPNGDTYNLRVKSGYNGDVALSQPASYYYMHKWGGRPMYKSWYA
jgi:hypothetical protein